MNFGVIGGEERTERFRCLSDLFLSGPDEYVLECLGDFLGVGGDVDPEISAGDFEELLKRLPPFESLYNYPIGERPRMWGRAAYDAHAFYASAGVMLDEDLGLPPDHAGVELLFMSHLITGGKVEEQRRFYEGHLLKWLPAYADTVVELSKSKFLTGIATALKEFLKLDYESLFE